jgi:hypothetical protein
LARAILAGGTAPCIIARRCRAALPWLVFAAITTAGEILARLARPARERPFLTVARGATAWTAAILAERPLLAKWTLVAKLLLGKTPRRARIAAFAARRTVVAIARRERTLTTTILARLEARPIFAATIRAWRKLLARPALVAVATAARRALVAIEARLRTIAVIAEAGAPCGRFTGKGSIRARAIRCRPGRVRPLHAGLAVTERLVAERLATAAGRALVTRTFTAAIAPLAETLSGMAASAAGAARGGVVFIFVAGHDVSRCKWWRSLEIDSTQLNQTLAIVVLRMIFSAYSAKVDTGFALGIRASL